MVSQVIWEYIWIYEVRKSRSKSKLLNTFNWINKLKTNFIYKENKTKESQLKINSPTLKIVGKDLLK